MEIVFGMEIKKGIIIIGFFLGICLLIFGLSFFNEKGLIMPLLTSLTIIVALFKEDISHLIDKPKLDIICTQKDFQEVFMGNHNESWLGCRIINKGKIPAKNVRVYFNGITSNIITDFENYKGLPLRRGWVEKEEIETLHTNIPIRYDIFVTPDFEGDRIDFSFMHTPKGLKEIICIKGKLSYFEFDIIAVADNANLVKRRIRIEFLETTQKN